LGGSSLLIVGTLFISFDPILIIFSKEAAARRGNADGLSSPLSD
jgi:hypothetical protein